GTAGRLRLLLLRADDDRGLARRDRQRRRHVETRRHARRGGFLRIFREPAARHETPRSFYAPVLAALVRPRWRTAGSVPARHPDADTAEAPDRGTDGEAALSAGPAGAGVSVRGHPRRLNRRQPRCGKAEAAA